MLEAHYPGEGELWTIARVMSGEEFLQAVEERALAGNCGNPLCHHSISLISSPQNNRVKLKAPRQEGVGPYCSSACATIVSAFSTRLGTTSQALQRFERLYEKVKVMREKRDEEMKHEDKGAKEPQHHVQESKDVYAAGTAKFPIMKAQVEEKPINTDETTNDLHDLADPEAAKAHSLSIEGYTPSGQRGGLAKDTKRRSGKNERRVRFSDPISDNLLPENAQAPSKRPQQSHDVDTATAVVDQSDKAVFILDIEDAKGHIEGLNHSLEASFGRLRLANEEEIGRAGLSGESEEVTVPADSVEPPIHKELDRSIQQEMSKYFPHLAAKAELSGDAHDIERSQSEDESESGLETWSSSEDEDEDGSLEDGKSPRAPGLSLFLQLYTHLDGWVTDGTIEYIRSSPGSSDQIAPFPGSVPEISGAFRRLIALALPLVLEKLEAVHFKLQVERALQDLMLTFCFQSALPAFKSLQWQLVVLLLLKALSLEKLVILRPVFETRQGIHRVCTLLAENKFTAEEFSSALELLVGEDM